MNQHLINLALALVAGEVVHNIYEAQEVRRKVEWLRLTMDGKKYKDYIPFQIDTRAKSYGLSLAGLVGFAVVFYLLFTWLNLSSKDAFWTIVVLLLLAYLATAFLLDKYHIEIARLTNPLRKKLK